MSGDEKELFRQIKALQKEITTLKKNKKKKGNTRDITLNVKIIGMKVTEGIFNYNFIFFSSYRQIAGRRMAKLSNRFKG